MPKTCPSSVNYSTKVSNLKYGSLFKDLHINALVIKRAVKIALFLEDFVSIFPHPKTTVLSLSSVLFSSPQTDRYEAFWKWPWPNLDGVSVTKGPTVYVPHGTLLGYPRSLSPSWDMAFSGIIIFHWWTWARTPVAKYSFVDNIASASAHLEGIAVVLNTHFRFRSSIWKSLA